MFTESETNQLKKHLRSLNIVLPQGMEVEEAGTPIVQFSLGKALRMRTTTTNNKGEKDA